LRGEESGWWERAARDDWEVAESLKRDGHLAASAFHFQQSAVKVLKAACIGSKRPAFTHSCKALLTKLKSMGVDVQEDLFYAARRLDPHYTEARYPNSVGGPPSEFYDERIISELRECANNLMSFAESLLSRKGGSTTS